MFGKGAILLVLGFSMIFLVLGNNMISYQTRSVENMSDYYIETTAHFIAETGANMAANQIFLDKTWDAGYQNVSFAGGNLDVYVSNNITASNKVIICHFPPGNYEARHTISVDQSSVASHQAHGCTIGPCDGEAIDSKLATIISEGTFQGETRVVVIELRPSYFSKFGNFYRYHTFYPTSVDTFDGPYHVNDQLWVEGDPVFKGKTTAMKKIKGGSPVFLAGYQSGVDLTMSFDTSSMRLNAIANGRVFNDTTSLGRIIDTKIYFDSLGRATYSYSIRDGLGLWTPPVTVSLDTLAPNGLIFVQKGNIRTSGKVNGRITMVATGEGNSLAGNVLIDNDLVYSDNPLQNPNSDDVLGIIVENNIRLEYNASTKHRNLRTQASMYAYNGTVGPDYELIHQDFLRNWYILGGIIAKTNLQTALYNSWGNPYKGLIFTQTFDERLFTYVPPFFPETNQYEVVSWYE